MAGQLIKTQSEIAQNLLDLQDKLKKFKMLRAKVLRTSLMLYFRKHNRITKMLKNNKKGKETKADIETDNN